MSRGILLIGESDPVIEARVKNHKMGLERAEEYQIPFEKTLILESGTLVPWDLLPAAWNFLNRWDSAVPLWYYDKTAEDLGSSQEKKLTREIIRDLRVPLYSYELLFVRKNEAGMELIKRWNEEIQRGPEKRLAFMRAYYQVKPRLCVLPVSWLAEIRSRSPQSRSAQNKRMSKFQRSRNPLIAVEISPGKYVKVHRGDKQKIMRAAQEEPKGELIMSPVITDRTNWQIETQADNVKKGKLIRVEISPGRYVKMYEADVKKQKKEQAKIAPASPNKIASPDKNKIAPPQEEKAEPQDEISLDDLTEIDGIGPATSRKLHENGISTFKELLQAGELAYLTPTVNAKIQEWRESSG